MIEINKIIFLKNILEETKKHIGKKNQMERLYNDASIALVELLGMPTDKSFHFDDGTSFPLTDFAFSVLEKQSKSKAEPVVDKPVKILVDTQPEEINEEKENELINDDVPTVIEQPTSSNSECSPFIVSKHFIKLVNKKNPSDVKELTFTFIPLTVEDNATTTDIALQVDMNGQITNYCSMTQPKSIQLEVGGLKFMVRGAWKNKVFVAHVYSNNVEYDLKDTSRDILPETEQVFDSKYQTAFKVQREDSELYVLPTERLNEPNGIAKTIVIQVQDDVRTVHYTHENVHQMLLGGNKYRVYGKWIDKTYTICAEQMDM